jgi:hypothetical protein
LLPLFGESRGNWEQQTSLATRPWLFIRSLFCSIFWRCILASAEVSEFFLLRVSLTSVRGYGKESIFLSCPSFSWVELCCPTEWVSSSKEKLGQHEQYQATTHLLIRSSCQPMSVVIFSLHWHFLIPSGPL